MLLWRSSRRYLGQHPWLVALSVLGVALGVAVVVAIDLANASAQRAFELSAETVTGKATHQVLGAQGGLPDTLYRTLRVDLGLRAVAPVVEGYVTTDDRTLQLLGIDPFAEEPFRSFVGGGDVDLGDFMARPRTALLGAPTADALGVGSGDTLNVQVDGIPHRLTIVGLLTPDNERSEEALQNLLITDVSVAQELLGVPGQLSRLDLIVPAGPAGDDRLDRVRAVLPPGASVQRSEARTETVAQMTAAFNLNLTALSLLALVVGMFLIYNTITFSVVQRRGLIGRLRALGVTRNQVFRLVLAEGASVGAVGTALGLGLGVLLAQGLVQLVTQTINDLYYVLTVREVAIAPWTLIKGTLLGLGTTILAALWPAREAARAVPNVAMRRSAEETKARDLAPTLAVAGLVLGAVGTGLLWLPSRSIVVSYAALLFLLLAFALVTPAAIIGVIRVVRPLMGRAFGVLGRMAARGVVATLSRTAVAIAALMTAVAAAVGVGIMVDSFRATVETWLDYSLRADVYVQPPSLVFRRGDATFDPAVADAIASLPGVARAFSVRSVEVGSNYGPTNLVAISASDSTYRSYRFKTGDPEAAWQAVQQGDGVLVSEPYSYRHGLALGDTVRLETDRGPRAYPVRGIFYDYGNDLGIVLLSRPAYTAVYDDRGLSGLALYAASGQSVSALVDTIEARFGAEQELLVRSNRTLRELSLDVFDRTFTITAVLRLLAIIVAFIGVLSALMALQLERARELAVLRATGLTPGQLWRYVTLQTGLMGILAGVFALPLGLVLATVLTFVINKRSFGWTLQFVVEADVVAQALLLAIVAALLAGLYPSWRMARANPADALREE